jgi:hypothetical protein
LEILHLPVGRLGPKPERVAFRLGLVGTGTARPMLRMLREESVGPRYCAGCAKPMDFGVVWRGVEAYCSVECSLVGGRPA